MTVFAVVMIKYCKELPEKVGEVSVIGGGQNLIRHSTGQTPAIRGPPLSKGVELDSHRSSLLSSTIL